MYLLKCDKCSKLSEPSKKTYGIEGFIVVSYVTRGYANRSEFHLCNECAESLKIPTETRDQQRDIAERLIDILSEIAQEATQE